MDLSADAVHSLTQASSLREVETLREQIYRIKGEDSVRISTTYSVCNFTHCRCVDLSSCSCRYEARLDWRARNRHAYTRPAVSALGRGPHLRDLVQAQLACARCFHRLDSADARAHSCRTCKEAQQEALPQRLHHHVALYLSTELLSLSVFRLTILCQLFVSSILWTRPSYISHTLSLSLSLSLVVFAILAQHT